VVQLWVTGQAANAHILHLNAIICLFFSMYNRTLLSNQLVCDKHCQRQFIKFGPAHVP